MKVIVACEFSGIVRDAFISAGHDAVSCDMLPSESPGPHLQQDIRTVDLSGFDLMIAHPDCTFLCVSGARWFYDPVHGPERKKRREEAVEFVKWLWNSPVPRVAIENPIGSLPRLWRKWDQIVQPFWFGDDLQKSTCLWLKNLPILRRTARKRSGRQACWLEGPSEDRWKNRSRTPKGFAKAMAKQWGGGEPPSRNNGSSGSSGS